MIFLERIVETVRAEQVGRGLAYSGDVRRHFPGLSKEVFDQCVTILASQDVLALFRHDYPASLTEQQRAEMVHDGRGNWFNGVAISEHQR